MSFQKGYCAVLIGRPNVGKSSLFNALLKTRRTIVSNIAGTTLDWIEERIGNRENSYRLADTQGIFSEENVSILDPYLQKADAIIFVVDGLVGLTPFDELIASRIRQVKKPTVLVVNKSENRNLDTFFEFEKLGFDSLLVSASHRTNIESIGNWVLSHAVTSVATAKLQLPNANDVITLALIGKPNTGKSSLMNRLVGENVSRVSPIAHTTRDPVSFEIKTDRSHFKILDTAGIRRPRSEKESIEVFSIHASTRAIHQADVVFLCIAAHEPMSDQDMRLLSLVEREGKPTVVLLNFWDLLDAKQQKSYLEDSEFAKYIDKFRHVNISAKSGFNVDRLFPLAHQLANRDGFRIPTAKLNKLVKHIIEKNPPPGRGKRPVNILYASQVEVHPPTFLFFTKHKENLPASYVRYLENQLRTKLSLKGQIVRLHFRGD